MLTEFPTDLGHMALATWNGEVVGLTFGHTDAEQAIESLKAFHANSGSRMLQLASRESSSAAAFFSDRIAHLLKRFALGEAVDFDDVSVASGDMTRFQKQVVAACRAIPWGETASYGQLADRVGHPGAARAVGTVMRKNRFPLIVPCHRVLAAGGQIGGYSAPSGVGMKRRLLTLERRGKLVTHC